MKDQKIKRRPQKRLFSGSKFSFNTLMYSGPSMIPFNDTNPLIYCKGNAVGVLIKSFIKKINYD